VLLPHLAVVLVRLTLGLRHAQCEQFYFPSLLASPPYTITPLLTACATVTSGVESDLPTTMRRYKTQQTWHARIRTRSPVSGSTTPMLTASASAWVTSVTGYLQ
jgi:hypothetical protein